MLKDFDYERKPIIDIVNEIIEDAVKRGASDIHFDPDETGIDVRIRIDGDLQNYTRVPESAKKNLITRVKIISSMNITEMRLPQDGAIKNLNGHDKLDMRVSSLPTIFGEKIVIRILNYSMSLQGLESIGFSKTNLKKVQQVIKSPNGIILVAGATGSGKSTTVYSMLQTVNTTDRNIITVEDPVEMKIKGLNQVQVMSEIGLDFNATLRSILRQDPDIIMIGEIRDSETARIAVRASITGHLVFSTIHTNNSLNTIERLLDMDIERYLLGSALEGIISQRLVKKICPKCRKSRPTTPYERNLFKKVLNKYVDEVYEACGCDDCIKGYKGRTSLHEVLVLDQEIRDAITNNVRKDELRKLVYKPGGTLTLLEDGLEKVIEGTTTIEEVLRVIDIQDDFGDEDVELKQAFMGKEIDEEILKTFDEPQVEVDKTITETSKTLSLEDLKQNKEVPKVEPTQEPVVTPQAPVEEPPKEITQPVTSNEPAIKIVSLNSDTNNTQKEVQPTNNASAKHIPSMKELSQMSYEKAPDNDIELL